MISERMKTLVEKFNVLSQMFFLQEIKDKIGSINSEEEWEKFIESMLTIYMSPIIEFSKEMIKKTGNATSNSIKYEKYALFIEETIARIYCDLLDTLNITSNRGRMEKLSGQTVAELIECTLEMEKLNREYRIKPPIFFPIENISVNKIQFSFPSKEKPIHVVLYNEKNAVEYYIEEVKLPKYQWVKRTREKKEYLNEFTIESPIGKK